MTHYASEQVRDNCWNKYDSYGEICVHCGCCSNNPKIRYKSRVDCLIEWLKERESFDRWDDDPELRAVQQQNNALTIKQLKRKLLYYSKRLLEVTNGKGEVSAQHQVKP